MFHEWHSLKRSLLICSQFPPLLGHHVVIEQRQKRPDRTSPSGHVTTRQGDVVTGYKPPFHADEIGLTSDKYVPLNTSVASLPLTITLDSMSLSRYEPISTAIGYSFANLCVCRWLLMSHMETSLKQQQQTLGFSSRTIDDVRRLISDTSTTLLGIRYRVIKMIMRSLTRASM